MPRMWHECALFWIGASLALAGCECGAVSEVDAGRDAAQAPRDAGASDAGSPDAGPADAGAPDAGPGDAGPSDAGSDAGPPCTAADFARVGDLEGGATSSTVTAISRDGTTVVGQSSSTSGAEAMRWTEAGGIVGLGDLAGASFQSSAQAVASDGSVVVGLGASSLVDCPGRVDEAFRWTEASGMEGLGDLAGGCFFSYAYAVSADGALVAGGGTNALAPTAATWTAAGGWTDLGFAAIDGNSSVIIAVTADGTVAVGNHRIDASPSYQAFRWSSAGGLELLGDLEGGALFASALDVADDGATIVGFGTSAAGVEAFRWTEAGGMTGLGDLEGGAFESRALALAPDASIVVGTGTTDAGLEAAVWEGALPIARLADLLAARGVVVPEGFVLSEAVAITIVGRTVVVAGNGTSPDGDPEGWVARFCAE